MACRQRRLARPRQRPLLLSEATQGRSRGGLGCRRSGGLAARLRTDQRRQALIRLTNAKAKNKAERVSASNRNGLVQYDRQEYAARLKAAAKEVGVIDDDDPPKSRRRPGANGALLFPD